MQNSISNIIDKIAFLKNEGINTSEFEKELDKLVYQVYGLTEDEIKTIEN